jgi:small-conductance mechanosensitive channel
MKPYQRIFLIVFGGLIALTGAGLVVTSDWGSRRVPLSKTQPNQTQSPVDLQQLQTAQTLAPLAATSEEQDSARNTLRLADHEVDFEFAAALDRAASQPVPSTPEIQAIQDRISKAQKSVADLGSGVARLTKLVAGANEKQKPALAQQLDLANARLELNQDELADAKQDLGRAGGDPQSRIQHMVDEHKSAEQSTNGQPDFSIVGKQAGSTLPVSNSFLSRARAWYALHTLVGSLGQAERDANAKAATFSTRHDDLDRQLEQAQSEQSNKLTNASPSKTTTENSAGATSSASGQTDAAISTYRSLTALQKRMSSLDGRIRNEQDLAGAYGPWSGLAATRERSLLHGLLVSFAWMLLIALAVVIADRYMQRGFNRLEPDQKKLRTLRAVAEMITRASGLILILLVIFGIPNQAATIVALAGAGLTVALKDFIVGFFGWFTLMGKNGIRHGDWVEINGVSGEVIEIGLFHTVLLETGNWNDSGHPTGRRVTFVNSYAIEGHYFNFSTSGQWLWDEMQVALAVDQDPYPIVAEIQKIVAKETEANAQLAEKEWEEMGNTRGIGDFTAGPAISVRPANPGFEILVRYVTRANERHQQRSKLYREIVELLRQQNIAQPATPVAAALEGH